VFSCARTRRSLRFVGRETATVILLYGASCLRVAL